MLVEYSFGNYKSFKDLNTLSMIGVRSFKEHEPENIFNFDKLKILKTAAIYGNNASGKSNLVSGLKLMKAFVKSSFRDALVKDRNLVIENFLLCSKTEKQPTHYELIFIYNKVKYRYGFKIRNSQILKEWLYHTTSKEVPLFVRSSKNFVINNSSFTEGLGLESKTRSDVLFLSLVAQFNGEISGGIINWFDNVNFISGIQDLGHGIYTMKKLKKDSNFEKWLSLIINTLEISNITTEETVIKEGEFDKVVPFKDKRVVKIMDTLSKIMSPGDNTLLQVSTWHKKYDENNLLVDTIPFDFNNQESEGTKKFINLLGPWYDTLKNGKILVVDELDSRLHTQLTIKLIELFHKYNKKKAQLIFTSHDIMLLDKNYLRRDQIWFTDKNQFGASELYSLADFKTHDVRNTSSYYKNYLNGKYGATPSFEVDTNLSELLYNG